MYNSGSSPTVTNCTFSGNSAANSGGGMYNWYLLADGDQLHLLGQLGLRSGGGMFNAILLADGDQLHLLG